MIFYDVRVIYVHNYLLDNYIVLLLNCKLYNINMDFICQYYTHSSIMPINCKSTSLVLYL